MLFSSLICKEPSSRSISGCKLSVTRPCPMPSVILDPLRSTSFLPELIYECRTLPGGSARKHLTFPSETVFRYLVVPAKVPPVPVAHVNASTVPVVCSQISGPVVSMCALRFAMLSNWFVHTAFSQPCCMTLCLMIIIFRIVECDGWYRVDLCSK